MRLPAICNDAEGVSVECQVPIVAGPGFYEAISRATVNGEPITGMGEWDGSCDTLEIVFGR